MESVVPTQWKEAIVVPIPKYYPPDIEKLRPISLRSQLSKICQKLVEQWIVNDITPSLDPMQFGSRQNHSTTHNLASPMDIVYKVCEEPGSVCTLVTTRARRNLQTSLAISAQDFWKNLWNSAEWF